MMKRERRMVILDVKGDPMGFPKKGLIGIVDEDKPLNLCLVNT
jgi:hypothetical protein